MTQHIAWLIWLGFLVVGNGFFVLWNINNDYIWRAVFNGVAAGACFMAFLLELAR